MLQRLQEIELQTFPKIIWTLPKTFEYHLNTLEDFRTVLMISEEFPGFSDYFPQLSEGSLKLSEMQKGTAPSLTNQLIYRQRLK